MTQQIIDTYNLIFTEYPDIVGMEEMRGMLGNISKKAGYKLIADKKIEAFKTEKSTKYQS